MDTALLNIWVTLTAEISLGVAVLAVYAGASRWTAEFTRWQSQGLTGVVFGMAGILALLLPVRLGPTLVISTAGACVGLGALFGGWRGALAALALTTPARFLLGTLPQDLGMLRDLGAAGAGWIVAAWARKRGVPVDLRHLVLQSALVAAGGIALFFALPASAQGLLREAGRPLLIVLPLSTILLGLQFVAEQRRQDLTRRLAESEGRLRDVINSLPGAVYQMRMNADGKLAYTFYSEASQGTLGVSGAQAQADASAIDRFFLPEEEEARQRYLRESKAALRPGQREFRIRLPDGRVGWVRTYSTPRKDAQGAVVWTGLTINIDAEKRKDEDLWRFMHDLAESERRMRAIVASVPGAVHQSRTLPDGSTVFTFVSEGIKSLIGYAAAEVLADPALLDRIRLPEEDEAARNRSLEEAIATGSPGTWEFRVQHRDGSIRWMHSRSIPHRQPNGEVMWDGVTLDVTERKNLEEELRRSERMLALGGLTDGVAHHFNNMLQIVSGNAELLQAELEGQPEHQKIVKSILSSLQRGARIVGELRRFSRHKADPADWLDVTPLLADLRSLAGDFVGSGITLTLRSTPRPWPAAVDATRLQTSILSLILNARDAMPRGGEIVLQTRNTVIGPEEARALGRPQGAYVEILVSDTGEGMPDEVLKRAMEPFFTTKPPGSGSGMGLSTVHGFVVQAGGHLSLRSTPGAGTEVRVLLPAKPDWMPPPGAEVPVVTT